MADEIKYAMTVHPTAGLVRSQSDGARAHAVTLPSCDCADYINRKGRLVSVDGLVAITLCKHIVEFLERVGGWNRAVPETVEYHDITRSRVVTLLNAAGVPAGVINEALSRVVYGQPSLIPASKGEIRIELQYGRPRLFCLTLPA
jgi:hypothetical protein